MAGVECVRQGGVAGDEARETTDRWYKAPGPSSGWWLYAEVGTHSEVLSTGWHDVTKHVQRISLAAL